MLYIARDNRQSVLEAGRRQQTVDIAQGLALLVRFCSEDSPAVGNRLGHWQKVTTEPAIQTYIEPFFKFCALLAGRQQFNPFANLTET